ncbi:MAG: polysaccharide deacetylase family protein [Treponema sp.]|nr:polysaccharide deacetylase family protein [Treponema sp.]
MKLLIKLSVFLKIFLILSSCVSKPEIIEPEPIPEIIEIAAVYIPPEPAPIIIPPPPEIIEEIIIPPPVLTPEEQLIIRIKENGDDIEKFFTVDRNERITIKADLIHNNQLFEITYDLENLIEHEKSVYEVGFTVRLIETLNKETQYDSDDHQEGKNDSETGNDDDNQPEIPDFIQSVLIWRPVPGNAGILLSFDDDYQDTWERYLDFFDEYEAKVTFFLMGGYHPFSALAVERGHDVGFHSLNHPDLRQLSREVFNREAIESAQAFRQAGIPVTSFAYPYGFYYNWMHNALLEHFTVLRGYGTSFLIYDKNNIKSSYIVSRAIDNTVMQRDDYFDYTIKMMLRTVKFMDRNWVLPMTSHNISNGSWAIRHNRLEFLLQTAADLKLKFYKYSDFE